MNTKHILFWKNILILTVWFSCQTGFIIYPYQLTYLKICFCLCQMPIIRAINFISMQLFIFPRNRSLIGGIEINLFTDHKHCKITVIIVEKAVCKSSRHRFFCFYFFSLFKDIFCYSFHECNTPYILFKPLYVSLLYLT